ncbi:radical SAM protein [Terriglobus sp. RCC_193]|uniref:B12-binding domain-containing radical SAM protein n=1 Tax=Terriglobus sp. RCC_193 TaxID=3239218 RepID=UPI0035247C7C
MHFALVTAPTITEFRTQEEIASRAVQQAALQPQLGILSVAAILEAEGDCPHVFDVNAEYLRFASAVDTDRIDDFAHHLADTVVRANADVYGFSSICSTFPLSLRVARAVKEIRPYATILFGGPQASVVDEKVIGSFPFVDFILRGEAEQSLPILLRELQGDYEFSRVPGLTFRDQQIVRRTPNAPVIEDLDSLPAPSYHLSSYLHGAKSASIELGRGCPFSCTFCSTNDFFRRRFRLRSPDRVLEEMRSIATTYGIRHFELVHDMFTVDRKRVVAFCETMQASGEDFTWDCSARTDCVDKELLQQMSASGCRGLFFGIESGSVRMQRIIDKDLDPARAQEMLRVCEQLGIRTTASLITGFPEEQWSDVQDTLKIYMQSARCSLSHPQINLLAPLAGTPLHTNHADELVLEDHCSDMSHQGLGSSEQDLDLIRTYPDIFPNFYMIPTPSLDREILFELREFLGMAVEHFRWMLCAIAQVEDILQFHELWQAWRSQNCGPMTKSDLRRYYASYNCRSDFLEFVRTSIADRNDVVMALVQVQEALNLSSATGIGAPFAPSLPHKASEASYLAPGVTLLDLGFDLDALIRSLTEDPSSHLECNGSYYATRIGLEGRSALVQISPFLSDALRVGITGSHFDLQRYVARAFEISDEESIEGATQALKSSLLEDRWIVTSTVTG